MIAPAIFSRAWMRWSFHSTATATPPACRRRTGGAVGVEVGRSTEETEDVADEHASRSAVHSRAVVPDSTVAVSTTTLLDNVPWFAYLLLKDDL